MQMCAWSDCFVWSFTRDEGGVATGSGAPPAPAGSYYQGWLRNKDGDAVTIGTFHGREGTNDIILWSGVDIADYPTLTVTIQQEGAGAESSGRVVLRGVIPAG